MRKYHTLEVLRRATLEKGLIGLASTLFKVIRSRFFGQRRLFFGFASAQSKALPVIEIPGYEVKVFTSWDTVDEPLRGKLRQHKDYFGLDPERMLKGGAYLWVGYLKGEAACFLWTQTGDQVHLHFFPLMPDDVLITRAVTRASHRGLGLFPATLVQIVRALSARGINRFYCGCVDANLSSRRSIERAGFKFIGHGIVRNPDRFTWYQVSRPDFSCSNHKTGL